MTDPHPMIRYLASLAQADDRRALAALRASLTDGRALDAAPYVFRFLPKGSADGLTLSEGKRRRSEDDAALVAGLFALHPESGSLSLASALKRVEIASGSDSIEARFRALLSCGRSELPTHLRHAVALVRGHGFSLDWDDLYRAVREWDLENAQPRRDWARDFWVSAAIEPTPDSTTPGTETTV